MLSLKNISKKYKVADSEVVALKDVCIDFRKSEFVSVLGPSGCGKTTLLNIIGGLDKYSAGDLVIDGKSTKEYKDRDWDTYRNHRVGFVFQSYNLIPHQTVLENVELALTLSGVSKKERRKKALEVLKQVGLEDKIKNRPNQLSGGQMQRVAIARALVNDPEIILADEPTGALDTKTSLQIMEILKKISKKRLIVMVTHNPELANKYSSRIIKLLDGVVVDDSKPLNEKEIKQKEKLEAKVQNAIKEKAKKNKKEKKSKMSFLTALALSFKNLLTKKGRTFLVAFAGSIGIIGISLILAISNGFNSYVNMSQRNTLSSYPVELTNSSYDMGSLMQIFLNTNGGNEKHDDEKVYTKQELTDMLKKFNASSSQSDLKSFKAYLEGDGKEEIEKYTTAIAYDYGININAFYTSEENGLVQANPITVFSDIISSYPLSHALDTEDKQLRYGLLNYMFGSTSGYYKNKFWSEMIDNKSILSEQYELVGEGSYWADEFNEIMIVIDKNNQISDYTLYGLGLLDQSELNTLLDNYIKNVDADAVTRTFDFEDLIGLEYKIILEGDFYEDQGDGTFVDVRTLKTTNYPLYLSKIQNLYNTKGVAIKVAGLIREKENANALSITTTIAYNKKLTQYVIEQNKNTAVVQAQIANNTKNVVSGEDFSQFKTKASAMAALGVVDFDSPQGIYLYPINFEMKTKITNYISAYNAKCISEGHEEKVVTYTDTIATIMKSVSTIISAITYVLIAFVGVSLIVSSIMIGIITYISVIERTNEIGVLRSVGASKRDVGNVFMAESFIIGLLSGVFGILISLILTVPINFILKHYTGIYGIASLPVSGAFILIGISVLLTLIAGFIPAKVASKKDPVIALRSE